MRMHVSTRWCVRFPASPVAEALPADAPTDSRATGRVREVLLDAVSDYALVGSAEEIRHQTDALREAGATTIVGHPARSLEPFVE